MWKGTFAALGIVAAAFVVGVALVAGGHTLVGIVVGCAGLPVGLVYWMTVGP